MFKRHAGFSLTELIMVLLVAMIVLAVGLPAFLRAYRSYQLSNAATQVDDILRLTRYEAIRLNRQVNCVIQPLGSNPGYTNMWADSNNNNVLDPGEKMILLGNAGNLLDSGSVPGATALSAAAKVGPLGMTPAPPGGSVISFDARGAAISPANVNVFYLASSLAPEAGYRAVLLMPSGSAQVWTSDLAGNWQQLQ